jgi:threonine dehydratase
LDTLRGMTPALITEAEIETARDSIDPVFLDSPLLRETPLDQALGCVLALKLETLNPIRSFKGRGTEALFAALSQKPKSVVATSTGNFGQGIARAARRRGIAATILAPDGANPLKLAAMERLGAAVRIVPAAEGDGKAGAARLAAETGAMMIEDGAHREIAAGAGVIGLELTEAGILPDILVIQLGDGALAAGIGSWLRARSPKTRIVGVVASGAPAMMQSLAAGRAVVTAGVDTIADGMAICAPIASSVAMLKHCIDAVVAVDDAAIVAAARLLLRLTGVLVEPSGAAGIAAIATHRDTFAGQSVAGVLTGSNLSPEFQRQLLQV